MRHAVVHVNLDPHGRLTLTEYERAIALLRDGGAEIVPADLAGLPPSRREIELLRAGNRRRELGEEVAALCEAALAEAGLGGVPQVGPISFLSRGTEEDARGVVRTFGLDEEQVTIGFEDDDAATFELERGALSRAAQAKLHTALEASLNRSVQLMERDRGRPRR